MDRHLEKLGDTTALVYESAVREHHETGEGHKSQTFTFKQLHDHVSRLAGVMQDKFGLVKGDRCIIYMPMIPEAVFAMLACARIGVIHSVVFGGFAAKELASRVADAKPKLIISASCGIEPHKTIDYKVILDESIKLSGVDGVKILIKQRPESTCPMIEGTDFDYEACMKVAKQVPCVPVEADHPLYILYTSGTTGMPKGVVRDQGGTCVGLFFTMKHIMNIGAGDMYFAGSDIGWVVGHSFIVYGPLLVGSGTILFEGKPHLPNPGVYWRMVEKYKVKGLYSSPTGLRCIRRADGPGDWIKKYDVSSLHNISMAGERFDIHTFHWLQEMVPKTCLINDNYWQTESGWPICCNFKNLHTFESKPGSCTVPAPGWNVMILDDDNQVITEPRKMGKLSIKLPLAPSFMMTLWGNDERFVKKYLSDSPGYYTSGDAGFIDEDGYVHVMTRLDDVINTAGHRLSTYQMEEVLINHPDVVESAVVSMLDDLKGEIPVGFVVLYPGKNPDPKTLEKTLVAQMRNDIGPICCFKKCMILQMLPKTRSGKCLRNVLKGMVRGTAYKVPPTISDASILPEILAVVKAAGLGQKSNLVFDEKAT